MLKNTMPNKRTSSNSLMNSKRINNYNKFLSTLDKTSYIKPTKINPIIVDTSIIKTKEHIKSEIDNIIDTIEKNFANYSSTNFTGLNANYSGNCCINNDPNYYRDILNKQSFFHYMPTNTSPYMQPNIVPYYLPYNLPSFIQPPLLNKMTAIPISTTPTETNKNTSEIKETIYIETEINNIQDILDLVEKYKLETNVQYNINMKVLHAIKEPLTELNNMIGMKGLKHNIVDQILYFVQELHINNNNNNDATNITSGDFMHTVIYGPPGTGKTEIAKIMGKIYSNIGVLKKGTFKKVTRSDLIAGYLGQTASKTQDVIKEALGGVLFIDEAYALGNPEKRDSFAKECIDTLCEALSEHKDNLMVIIAGYEKELKECFFKFNQGLDSRFTWRFKTDEYNHEDLYKIFLKKVKEIGWTVESTSNINVEWFKKNKDYFKFYGRDIENILAKTKIAHSRRVFCKSVDEKRKITLNDLDAGFEMYLKNEDVKNRKQETEMKNYITSTLYS
jgi:Cdc6-like AAA superfamily ATPase